MNPFATVPVGRPTPAARPPADTDTPPPGLPAAVGRFRVERELGRGGMGTVLLAHDRDLGRPVAVKLLHDAHPEAVARFGVEAQALAGLSHPNAVRVFEAGEHAGRSWPSSTSPAATCTPPCGTARWPPAGRPRWWRRWPGRCRRPTPAASSTAT